MNISESGIDFIRFNEGCKLSPYLDDAGVPTIGIGTIRYPNGKRVAITDPAITVDLAELYLANDIKDTVKAVNSIVVGLVLTQNQFDSLVDFSYNEGSYALAGSTLLKRIKANTMDSKIRAAFMLWNKVRVDGRLIYSDGLNSRRIRDADLWFKQK